MADPFVLDVITATIAAGASLSPEVDFGGKTLVGIWMPANWTAADLTFQASPDGGASWGELQDGANNAIDLKIAASEFIQIDPTKWRGVRSIKVRSGTSGSPVNQTDAMAISLLIRFVF